jgi:hypothetical protein
MNTELIVFNYTDDTNTSYSIYESLDLKDNEQFPLNFSIADVRNPQKRNTSFSKTITLPDSKKNNKLFGSIFEIGVDSSFNPNKKINAIIVQDGYQQLNGVLQLKRIIKNVNNDDISYEVVIFGQFANLFYNIGDTKLCDLDLSEYNHTYEFDTIIPSWNDYIETVSNPQLVNWVTGYTTTFLDTEWTSGGGYVTLITNGNHQFKVGDTVWVDKNNDNINFYYNGTSTVLDIPAPNKITINKPWGSNSTNESGTVYVKEPTGEGYTYPLINYGAYNNVMGYGTPEGLPFAPAVYVKTIVDKIFEQYGFKYESDFFNSSLFRRLIIPFNGERPIKSELQLQEQEFRASLSSGDTTTYTQVLYQQQSIVNNRLRFNVDTASTNYPDLYDNNNNYITTLPTPRFVSQYNTKMKFETIFDFSVNINPNSTAFTNFFWGSPTEPGRINVIVNTVLNRNGDISVIGSSNYEFKAVDDDGVMIVIPQSGLTLNNRMVITSNEVEIKTNDIVFNTITLQTFSTVNYFTNPANLTYIVTDTPEYNNVQIRITPNTNNSRFYNIVTDNTLRDGDTVLMNKILPCEVSNTDFLNNIIKMFNLYVDDVKDKTNTVRIEPRNDFYGNSSLIDWTNKLDVSKEISITPLSELSNKNFKFTYKQDKDYLNDSYELTYNRIYGDKLLTVDNDFLRGETVIQPTFSPTPNINNESSYISFPSIYKQKVENNTTQNVNTKSNIRILYYGGLKSYLGYQSNNINSKFLIGGLSGVREFYPYCGMDDDGYIPYQTLNYNSPLGLFYQMNSYTNDNLFNRYWRNYIIEITDKNSKKVECFINITPKDIFELDFRNTILIDGQYYRLNRIIDFNPLTKNTTKVELIKVIDTISFQNVFKTIENGFDSNIGDPATPSPFNPSQRQYLPNNIRVIGELNNLNTKSNNILINGNNNFITQESNNISIIGSDNVSIIGNLNNVTVIGTNNVTITESNTTVINGVKYVDGVLITPFNVADGIENNVFLLSPITTNIIDGSVGVAFNIGSSLPLNVIDASIDIAYQI